MDQVSRPLLIVLGAVVLLLVLWLVALKPKPVSVDSTPLAPTQAITTAKQAVATSDAANAQVQAATGQAAPAPTASAATPAPAAAAPAAPAAPARDAGRLDGSILRDIRRGRVVVMLFWNAQGADDIATRGAIRALDRHHGKVAVHVVSIAQVGRYPAITRGVAIAQSPTTLVIGRKRHARAIVGLSEPQELSQAVDDALAGR
ncbi:MAG: hypothetical protein QOD69_678 [Solirubrobacteraceae bacterium]|jgi:hypothetical protein|nr:hypothetical protein [Solirubrobacteraceae bacterium]